MDIIIIQILTVEICLLALILIPVIWLNSKVKKLTARVNANNRGLRELIKTVRSILKLSGEYVDLLRESFKEKIYSLVVFIGEITSFSIMRRMFSSKNYQNFVIGFNIARLLW